MLKAAGIFLLLVISQISFGQIRIQSGPEVGISASHLPKHSTQQRMYEMRWAEQIPILSPVLGYHVETTFFNHLQLSAGIQYQMTGTKRYSYSAGQIPWEPFAQYTDESVDKHIFHKVTFPIALGYRIGKGNLQPSLFIGVRPNYLAKGKVKEKYTHNSTDDSRDKTSVIQYDPTNPAENGLYLYQTDWVYQATLGASVTFHRKIKLAATFHSGGHILFAPSSLLEICIADGMVNNDFNLSLTYLFH